MFLKLVGFDIEVLPIGEQMPKPETSPVLLVSCHFNYDYHVNYTTKTRNIVLLLHKNKNDYLLLKEKVVFIFNSEEVLLRKLFDILRTNDVIIGFNSNNFDIPYIIDRAKVLGIKNINIGNGDSRLWYRRTISKGFSTTKIGGTSGKIIFDVLMLLRREDESNVFKKKYNLKRLKLEHVSKEILGYEKLEFSISNMEKYWSDCDNLELRDKFIDYCSRDSELALLFVTKFRLLDKFITLSRACGKITQELVGSYGSGMMVENLLLKEFKKYDRIFPIRIHNDKTNLDDFDSSEDSGEEEEEKELEGAEVFKPVLGVSENICSVDYQSLYPSIMIKHNLCFSTLVLEELYKLGLTEDDVITQTTEDGTPFAKFIKKEKFKGIVPQLLEKLLAERARLKKEMKKYEKGTSGYLLYDASQNATKILLNSFYGYSGDVDAKVYSWFVASAVTTNGRKQIKKTWNMITEEIGKVKIGEREFKLGVVQGDTDSSYMQVISLDGKDISRNEAISVVNFVLDKVNATLEKPMQLNFENYVKRIVIVAKKHYAMLVVDDNNKQSIVSKGIETVRRDWCDFATKNMSKIVDYILTEKDVNIGIEKSTSLIREEFKKLNSGNSISGEVNADSLILSKRLTKPLTTYDAQAVHVLVSKKMRQRGKSVEIGDRIQYIITNNGKRLVGERAEEAEYVIQNNIPIDRNYYIMRQLLPPALRVLTLLGINEKILVSKLDERQTSLFDF